MKIRPRKASKISRPPRWMRFTGTPAPYPYWGIGNSEVINIGEFFYTTSTDNPAVILGYGTWQYEGTGTLTYS